MKQILLILCTIILLSCSSNVHVVDFTEYPDLGPMMMSPDGTLVYLYYGETDSIAVMYDYFTMQYKGIVRQDKHGDPVMYYWTPPPKALENPPPKQDTPNPIHPDKSSNSGGWNKAFTP